MALTFHENDENILASASIDETIKFWNIEYQTKKMKI